MVYVCIGVPSVVQVWLYGCSGGDTAGSAWRQELSYSESRTRTVTPRETGINKETNCAS